MMLGGFGLFTPLLIVIAFWIFVIYMVITAVKLMRERNQYLKEIRDELRKSNHGNNASSGDPQ